MLDREAAIAELARKQHGVVSRQQLLALGLSRAAIDRRRKNGTMRAVTNGVYTLSSSTGSLLRDATAALLACDGTVLARTWAAAWWELKGFTRDHAIAPVTITGPISASSSSDTIDLERTRTLHDIDSVPLTDHDHAVVLLAASERRRVARGGNINERTTRKPPLNDAVRPEVDAILRAPRVTTPARTVIDIARTWLGRPRGLDVLIDDTIARGLVTVEDLAECLDRCLPPRSPGRKALVGHLDKRGGGFHAPESELERIGRAALRDWGCPTPKLNHPIPGRGQLPGRVDFAFPAHRVVIELDGRRWHLSEHGFQADRDRDRAALLENWRPFRFTWTDFTSRKAVTEKQVRAIFAAQPDRPLAREKPR